MLAPHPSDHSERRDLVRGLGLRSAIAIVIGDTIGTGVFLVASDMARAVGSATQVLIAWILGLLIVLLGAFCYAELGAAFPKAGGPYVYLSRGLGPLWGFPGPFPGRFLAHFWPHRHAQVTLSYTLHRPRPTFPARAAVQNVPQIEARHGASADQNWRGQCFTTLSCSSSSL